MIAESPAQGIGVVISGFTVRGGSSVITAPAVKGPQPFASATETVYVPAINPVAVGDV
jgi:hypothetical protein